jgi:hypothetical protein
MGKHSTPDGELSTSERVSGYRQSDRPAHTPRHAAPEPQTHPLTDRPAGSTPSAPPAQQ